MAVHDPQPVHIAPANTPPTSSTMAQSRLDTLDILGRRRVQHACRACKLRKRKCNGAQPCRSCVRGEYDCSYSPTSKHPKPRRRPLKISTIQPDAAASTSSAIASSEPRPQISAQNTTTLLPSTRDEKIVANSGTVFARLLGLQLGAEPAVLKVQALGWNLDLRPQPRPSERSVVWIISRGDWQHLFDVFASRVHPLYDFLDLPTVTEVAERRWGDASAANAYDHVLCGIAALGSVFNRDSDAFAQEESLVDCARELCERAAARAQPQVGDVEAWILRTLYLRCCNSPHAAWMASCTTIHMAEATGLHQESENASIVYTQMAHNGLGRDRQRRLFWLATLLNTWISYEYGRSAVSLENATCQMPKMVSNDSTTDLLHLFHLSHSLGPAEDVPAHTIEECVFSLDGLRFGVDALTLSQCNLAFAFYRRLRSRSTDVNPKVVDAILKLGCLGLEACSRLIEDRLPWWHVANVPFQFSCIILAMDSHQSYAHINQAVTVLGRAVEQFGTRMPSRALETVHFLIRLCQNRKEQDIALLAQCAGLSTPPGLLRYPSSASPRTSDPTNWIDDGSIGHSNVFSNSYMQTVDFSSIDWLSFGAMPLESTNVTDAFAGE